MLPELLKHPGIGDREDLARIAVDKSTDTGMRFKMDGVEGGVGMAGAKNLHIMQIMLGILFQILFQNVVAIRSLREKKLRNLSQQQGSQQKKDHTANALFHQNPPYRKPLIS